MSGEATIEGRDVAGRAGRYQPALDGLRAIAVVAAMLFHANVLSGGFLGVDLFFVISGYLITGLLLNEAWARRTIDLARFYTRRFRRLAPALVVVLLVTLTWAYLFAPPALAPAAAKQVGWSVAYMNNWYALFGKVGYWGAGSTGLPLNHLWSLAIEEQFYLVWPLVIIGLVRAKVGRRALTWVFAALAVVSGVLQWFLADHGGVNRAYLGTDTRFSALAIGAIIAVVLAPGSARRVGAGPPVGDGAHDRTAFWWKLATLGSAAFLATAVVTADLSKLSFYHGRFLACSAAAGVLVAGVVARPSTSLATTLSSRPLVWIGKRSYSLYLWHWPIWVMVTPASIPGSTTELWTVRILLTVVVSALSYQFVEQPIRTSSLTGRGVLASLGPIAAGVGALVILAPPVLPASLGNRPVLLGETPAGAAGSSPGGGLRIMVAGDSWGRNMGYALTLADTAKRNTIIDLGIPGCGLLTPEATGCSTQLPSWSHAEMINHPDAALLVEGTYDQGAAEQKAGAGAVCAPAYEAQYKAALDEAIATLHGPTNLPVFITTDRPFGDQASANCMNDMIRAAAKRDSATVFDLAGLLCPHQNCVTQHNGEAVYDETVHLAPGGQRWVGGLVLTSIVSHVRPGNESTPPSGPCQATSATTPVRIDSYQAQPDPPYLDSATHSKLIDGVYGTPNFTDPAWMGWETLTNTITEQLAAPAKVCSASSQWLQELSGAVVVPPTIEVYVSATPGQLGQLLGASQAPQLDRSDQVATVTVTGSQPIVGQYVTLRVNSFGSWSMVDEVGVRALP